MKDILAKIQQQTFLQVSPPYHQKIKFLFVLTLTYFLLKRQETQTFMFPALTFLTT